MLGAKVELAHASYIKTLYVPVLAALFLIVPVTAIEYVVTGVVAVQENCKEFYVKVEVDVPTKDGVIEEVYVIAVVQFGTDYIVKGETVYVRLPTLNLISYC